MTAEDVPADMRSRPLFHHIDMGFVNRRLCLATLSPSNKRSYEGRMKGGSDHHTTLLNDHLLVTLLLDTCDELKTPTLLQALEIAGPRQLFRSTERLDACPEVYDKDARVKHRVRLDVDCGVPVELEYHTSHITSDTGRLTLSEGADKGYVESIVGVLHKRDGRFEIEPLVIGAPWFEHPRNEACKTDLMWIGSDFGEVLPEDFDQFSKVRGTEMPPTDEWMPAMKAIPEAEIKIRFGKLLSEPTVKDWGGEKNDHFSANVSLSGRKTSAAFMFKGPTHFREMTLEVCGKRADQVHRLVDSGAEVSVVQHSHLVGEVVRRTLRALTVFPGSLSRKYCVLDGPATYRILKAYALL